MNASMLVGRMKKEFEILQNPSQGISAYPKNQRIDQLEATIQGPDGTPYEKGVFKLEIGIPERYPLEPPKVRFLTQIYHPNIDEGGRICLNILVMPPKGGWTPSLNISTVLTSIQSLLAEPNPDDGLVQYISEQYKHNRNAFVEKAREFTQRFARAKMIYFIFNHL